MLLVEFTINSVLNRLSQEGIVLAHYWDQKVMTFTPPKYAMTKRYGGYVRPTFGEISFSPDLLDNDWPPPVNGEITIKYTSTTEANAEVIFQGTAHLKSINRTEITYGLFGPSFGETIAASTDFTTTDLDTVMTSLAEDSGYLNLTIDTTYSRSPSPVINYTTSQEQLVIDFANGICEYCSHLFEIKDTDADGILDTLYLVDMLGNRGSRSVDEFEFFPSSYNYNIPTSIVRDSTNGYIASSSYPYGNEVNVKPYDDNQSNIEIALGKIKDILLKPRAVLRIPFEGNLPVPGEQITIIDESQGSNITAIINSRNITNDFDKEEIIIEGEGAIS